MTKLLMILPFFFISLAQADICSEQWAHDIPTRDRGRVRPLLSQAMEIYQGITNKSSRQKAWSLFCQLSLGQNKSVKLTLQHPELIKKLKLESSTVDYDALVDEKLSLRMLAMQNNNLSLQSAAKKILNRVSLYENVSSGQSWSVYQEGKWVPIAEVKKDNLKELLLASKASYDQTTNPTYHWENVLLKARPFDVAILTVLLAILVIATGPRKSVITGLLTLAVAPQIGGIILRCLVSGRAPITNMYETVMFSGGGALIISIFLYAYLKNKSLLLAGLAYNLLCLLMMRFAYGMLSPHINPLVPVLRDNFWLSTHVTTVILSYAALALSWVLSNIEMLKEFSSKTPTTTQARDLIYNCIKVGLTLLSAGVILGGVWADYSWGRFWGWDPKETWSLIVIVIYAVIVHGKRTNWITPVRFTPIVALAFLSVMMAWFGVNYILASGLHSYGFSEGGAIFLGSFFIVQIVLLAVYSFHRMRHSEQ